jgi:integrase
VASIIKRHKRACRSHRNRGCNCSPSFQARVKPNGRRGKPITKTFPSLVQAKTWAKEVETAKSKGLLGTRTRSESVQEAGQRLLADMRQGVVRTRKGDVYKSRSVESYETSLIQHVYPAIGMKKVGDVERPDVQRLVDEMLRCKANPSTIRNAINPLRVLYRRVLRAGGLDTSPCDHLALPALRGRRERIANPAEAKRLLDVLNASDRGLWAVAFYAGLRRGEIAGLCWADIDFGRGLIHVRRSYDPSSRTFTDTKSEAGMRSVPLIGELSILLLQHQIVTDRREGLVFGNTARTPFTPSAVRTRANRAWSNAELDPIKLHGCRHTYASLLIASGVNRKELATYMGHAQVATSEDLYGHLFPGHESTNALRLEAYLRQAYGEPRADDAS